jgi:hypothetical protein
LWNADFGIKPSYLQQPIPLTREGFSFLFRASHEPHVVG